MQSKSITLLQRIDSDIEQILQKFQDTFELATNQDKSKELLSVESLSMEANATLIIRLCEDLLTISRHLKETWCLGSLKVDGTQEDDSRKVDEIYSKFNYLTDKISQLEESNAT
ncbi:Piso0_004787 [Millerozyma farinosa CBS 7064]|uniref:Piso0_004787 protein n=1 Tax=Pichia sorbitophila (strain ATCC MYA-4447 / BCRC 22081 / CBS 7064 / NBRC 10061 / NRRL Y-12695) TaxID=559304 RepID=G8Y0F1_PICSO|nr:Piso0_004787 [Millerozyma farinosa CBS 7064]